MVEHNSRTVLSRRRFIQATGTAGAAVGLAGCLGGSGGGDAGSKSGKQPIDSKFSLAQWAVPKDSQYNPYNGKNYAEPRRMLYDRFMEYNLANDEYHGSAIQDWSFKGNTLKLTVRDGLKWHDGSDVTSRDLWTQLQLDMYSGGSLADYVDDISESVTVVDNRTVKFKLNPINKQVVLGLIQSKRLGTKHEVYKKYLKTFQSATSEEERGQALADLTSFAYTDPIGNGPFKFEAADTRRTLLTQFKDHPDADQINFPKVEYLYGPTNQKRWNMLINGQTDGSATLFMPKNKLQQLPEYVQVARIPRHWGMGLMFNWRRKKYRDENVRKAFTYAINRKTVAKNAGSGTNTKLPVSIPCGITGEFSNSIKNRWLKGVVEKFDSYNPNTQKAASLLRKSGYKKRNGTWHKNGKPLTATLKCPSGFSDWVAGCRTIVSQLDSFGVDATLLALDTATYWGQDYANGNFDLAVNGWANYNRVYPFFHFDWLYRSHDSEDIWKVPDKFMVPPLSNPSASPRPVVPDKWTNELSKQEAEQAQKTIQNLAWVLNQKLPVLPIMEKLAQSFQTTDHWNVPPVDSPKLQVYWPTSRLPREGNWTAKTQ